MTANLDQVTILRKKAQAFIEKLIDHPPGYLYINTQTISRQALRGRMIHLIAKMLSWQSGEAQVREKTTSECVARYGPAIDAFIEENVDLIAEIRMAVSA